ncbi:uncharacterized protein, partial [Temnothorax nylanderi]|uniref:uncharacterized protein n=1 Tax=Temnothorax nylanderi TaxID=102681 RepID=UPI003A8ABEE9
EGVRESIFICVVVGIKEESISDFEQCEVSNEILNDDNYESPSNFSDNESDNEPIDNDEDDTTDTLKADLSQWALKYAIHHKAINDLLPIISKYIPSCSLPRDARTLLKTPRKTNIVDLAGGQYVHFGLMPALHSIMQEIKNAELSIDNINLSLNIDDLPISKSSTNSFWPILISGNIFQTVEVIGVYYGQKKPTSANDYLRKFVNELKSVIDNGFIYENRLIKVKLSTIICDTPAKSFILNVKGHTGFSSCSKCTIAGQSVNRTTCFPYEDVPSRARTDEEFIRQSDEDYHRGRTILTEIPNIGLVTNVTLDYMHLVCLGIVKKLILLWIKRPLSVRIGNNDIIKCSRYMVLLHDMIPSEFSRKPRVLTDVNNWKATEFRQFILYTGPIVLQSFLKEHIYVHFLSFHVALSILVSPSLVEEECNIKYAEDLLKYFVENFQTIYGVQFMSHNVHNLLHLCDEVRKFGSLDNFSAFPFENFMMQIKKVLRKFEKTTTTTSAKIW